VVCCFHLLFTSSLNVCSKLEANISYTHLHLRASLLLGYSWNKNQGVKNDDISKMSVTASETVIKREA